MKRCTAVVMAAAMAVGLLCCGVDGPSGGSDDDDDDNTTTSSGGATTATGGSGATGGQGGGVGASGGASSGGSGGNSSSTVDPPLGTSSKGSGGPAPVNGSSQQASGVTYRLIVPSSPPQPAPLLVVYSGTEGGQQMTNNLQSLASTTGTSSFVRAVLDGVVYNGNGSAGATVIDDLRSRYDIDNDRTYLLGESAGTTAALQLGLQLRQSYFAAYWANDVNASASPSQTASQLGFAPWGQAGPGGQQAIAQQIVDGMSAAGYQLPNPAPYAGAGSGTHGSTDQFIAALSFFAGKARAAL